MKKTKPDAPRRRPKRRVSPDTHAPEEPQAPEPSLDAEIRPRRPDEPPEPEPPELEPDEDVPGR